MIQFDNVTKSFSGPGGTSSVAVKNLSLSVQTGETLCLIGESGCGKTTAIKLVNRLVEPSAGRVLVDGADVLDQDPIQLRRRIGYVIQSGGLFPHMTVSQNVGLPCEAAGWQAAQTNERVDELLDLVNLPTANFSGRYPAELSGGQRQRVGIARALATDPGYILMDEPFGALDPITRKQIHDEFLRLRDRVGKTVLMVTHDVCEAFKLGHRVGLMRAGELVQIGSEKELLERPSNRWVELFFSASNARRSRR